MKAYVITVPEATEQARCCINSALEYNIQVEIFEAFTPEHSPANLMGYLGLPTKDFINKWCRFEKALSCFLSHYFLWMNCIQDRENYLIFEHDAVVTRYINITVPFKGVLSFGTPSFGVWNTPKYIGVNKLVSKEYFPGAHAYLIKPEAAERLIQQAKIDACPTDVFLHNDRFDFLEEYYPWPVVVKDTFTTVQKLEGCLAKHTYRTNPEEYKII